MKIHLNIPFRPLAQPRHRDSKWGGKYDPYKEEKKEFLALCKEAYPEYPFVRKDASIRIDMRFKFRFPQTFFDKIKGQLFLKPEYEKPVVYRPSTPDFDNLLKFCTDALTGTFWDDDKQIVAGSFSKEYAYVDWILIEIEYLEDVVTHFVSGDKTYCGAQEGAYSRSWSQINCQSCREKYEKEWGRKVPEYNPDKPHISNCVCLKCRK
jgi:Holliday junction resolvase RusA-like endonuclease